MKGILLYSQKLPVEGSDIGGANYILKIWESSCHAKWEAREGGPFAQASAATNSSATNSSGRSIGGALTAS